MTAKPPNQHRALRSVSFNLSSVQLEQVRAIAYARDVSVSQVVRDALELALAPWESEWPDDARGACEPTSSPRPPRTRAAPPPVRPRVRPSDD